jgi:hypothetical protein
MYSTLLGFDIRQPLGVSATLWTDAQRERFLLRPDIRSPLSIDTMIWPSEFAYPSPLKANKPGSGIRVEPLSESHSWLSLWPDYATMESLFLREERSARSDGIPIDACLLTEIPALHFAEWRARLEGFTINPFVPHRRKELGFDVASRGDFISGLSNCAYSDAERIGIRNEWSKYLNAYGLLETVDAANSFRQLSDRRVVEHAPFDVFLIHEIIRADAENNGEVPELTTTRRS